MIRSLTELTLGASMRNGRRPEADICGRSGLLGRLPIALILALVPSFSLGDTTTMPLQTNAALAAGDRPVRIVGFGDSITGVYYHTGGRRAWPEMLGVAIQRIYPNAQIQIINAGVSGGKTSSGLARIDADVLAHRPDLVVVMFGMNDVAAHPPDVYEANLRTIIEKVRAIGSEVVLCTPNAISQGDERRPLAKLGEYADIVRRLGAELGIPLVDFYTQFAAIQTDDPRRWITIMSDAIHPNMRGHELFAEQIAQAITGHDVSLADAGPLPGLPHVQAALQEGRPLRIVAQPPYDTLIQPAINALSPQAQCEIVTWDTAGQSLAQIEAEAKARGWFAFNQNPELPKPTLVVIAVPASAAAPDFERFYRSYTWVLNWSLSFGPAQWDALAVLPEVTQPDLIDEEHERAAWALEVVLGQDIPYLTRPEGKQRGADELLHAWLREQLQP